MFPQVFGKFVLEGELSRGGMARVFLATLRGAGGFEKRLVVKQIRPELVSDGRFVERFVEEAKTCVELTHPNIVPVYELGVEAGVYYIAMELCPGVTLAELLAAEGELLPEEGAYVGVELARALGYAHRRAGIVHRDVTPRNVLIDDEGAVRLIDFGIAAPVASASDAEREVFGTPGHMPPEQIRGQRLTPAADVFALGALLYECFSGVAPFRRASEQESLRAVESAPPPLGGGRLAALAPLIAACFSERPEERPQEMEELGRALRDFLREVDVGDVARALGGRVRRVRRASLAEAQKEELVAEASARGTRPLPTPEAERASQLSRTFATRPLSALPRGAPPPQGASRTRRGAWLVVAAALVVGVAAALWRASPAARSTTAAAKTNAPAAGAPSEAPAELRSVAPSPRASSPAPALPKSSAQGSPSAPRAPSPSPSRPSAANAVAPSAQASPEGQKRGLVALTAAPSARVTIAGRTLETPVMRLELPAGTYRATFESPTWDGGISVSVEISEAAPRFVHADFTSQPPRAVVK